MAALWSRKEIAKALQSDIGGNQDSNQDIEIEGVSIDSRTLKAGDLFIAVKGEHRDGAAFISEALKRGAAAVISEQASAQDQLFHVVDSYQALLALARAARARASAKVVAITGSVGKTGVKDHLAFLLSAHAAEASFNNHWGVPLSLARMRREAHIGVFEIGMNHQGEISPLAELVKPDFVLITQIAKAHLEFFDGLESIAAAKAEIFDGLKKGGTVLLNRDDDFYDFLQQRARARADEVIGFGSDAKSDARFLDMHFTGAGAEVEARIFEQQVHFLLKNPARALALNAVAVLASVAWLGGDVQEAASRYHLCPERVGRGKREQITLQGKTITLIDESYNANPSSMAVALEALGNLVGKRKVAVLGDMAELGEQSSRYHQELLGLVEKNSDYVFTCGEKMKHLYQKLPKSLCGPWSESVKLLYQNLQTELRDGDVVMVKASKAAGFEQLVLHLKEQA